MPAKLVRACVYVSITIIICSVVALVAGIVWLALILSGVYQLY